MPMQDSPKSRHPLSAGPEIRTSLNAMAGESLRPAAFALTALYLVLSVARAVLLPRAAAMIMVPLAAGTALVCGAIYAGLRRRPVPPAAAHPLAVVIAVLVLLNSLTQMALVHDARQTTDILLLLVGAGSFLLSYPWLAVVLLAAGLGWVATAAHVALSSSSWFHYGFALLAAMLLAVLIHAIRFRSFVRLETQRIEERRRHEDLLRAERGLQAAEDLLQLFERNPQPMWVFGLDMLCILAVNEAAIQLYGYSREEFLAMTVKDLCPIEDLPALLGHLGSRRAAAGAASTWGVWRHCKKDRTIIDVEVKGHVIFYSGNEAQLVVVNDVSERHHTAEALRAGEARYRQIIETAQEGVWMTDQDQVTTLVNPRMAEMLGYGMEELSRKPVADFIPPEACEAMRRNLERRRMGIREEYDLEFIRKDGSRVQTSVAASPLTDAEGRFVGSIAFITDLTYRRQLEEQFRQAQKMEAVGRLAGGVAHDFNNLLTIISGYSDLMIENLDASAPARKHIEEIRKAAGRATDLTRQLLAFSRQQVLSPRILDLNEVVGGMENMLRRLIGEDIELVVVPGPGLAPVRADAGQIEQVIMNLAVNSRDAMPQGGRLALETANVELDDPYARDHVPVRPGPYIMLAVTDTGTGMPMEIRRHIFEPFFTTKDKSKGTGLGLAMVYGIVKQSGGYIWVYSEPGRGTTFKIYLPRVGGERATLAPPETKVKSLLGQETVLIAEDESPVRELVRGLLGSWGYNVLEAEDGAAALALGEKHEGVIDLLLTDAIMPQMSGRELAWRLAARRPQIKVLFMSGYTEDALIRHGMTGPGLGELEPGTAFIQKPFTPNSLARKLREVLDSPPSRPPVS